MKLIKCLKVICIPVFLLIFNLNFLFAQIDSAAVAILDRMSFVLSGLESCSFKLSTENDVFNDKLGLIKLSEVSDVFLKGPDKLLINKKGDKGQKDLFYNGKTLTYFSSGNKQYSTADAPPTIMEMIEEININYGIDFPAADVFYPDFVDDLLAFSYNVSYLGITNIDDKKAYHVAGTAKDFTYQLWIAEDGSFLPVKMAIVYTNQTANPQYHATFQSWNLNPAFQDSMFEFTVPAEAKKVKFVKVNKN